MYGCKVTELGYNGYEGYGEYGLKISKFVKRALPKPIRKLKPIKFIKRATGSKHLSSALLKIGAGAALIGGGYYLVSNPAVLGSLTSTVAKGTGTVVGALKSGVTGALPVVKEVGTAVLSNVAQATASQYPQTDMESYLSQVYQQQMLQQQQQQQILAASLQPQIQTEEKDFISEYLPYLALGGIALLLLTKGD